MLRRRCTRVMWSFCLGAVLAGAAAMAQTERRTLLLTAEEFDANRDAQEELDLARRAPAPDAPQIIVELPDANAPVSPPIAVTVHFKAADGARIDVDSLRVKYGLFDITNRVREGMSITPDGITGAIDTVRAGEYSLRLSISDDRKREATAKLVFVVVDGEPERAASAAGARFGAAKQLLGAREAGERR